ncbi:MAG: GbsR/MarR family transcriptional regulator [Woeseiaceae bacterium]|jgi:DNA-binding transcriptional regulator GbsR (MarR family)
MSPYVQRFVMHIGEMGSRWGLNRTLGQMCGLLYVSPQAMNADEIAETLNISRSNVSMGLKELKTWRLVQPASVPGDRREYWTTSKDVWELFRILAEERRRREVDPTLSMLRETLMAEPVSENDRYAQERLREMHDLIEMLNNWVDDMNSLPQRTLIRLLKLGRKIQKLLKPRGSKTHATEKADA